MDTVSDIKGWLMKGIILIIFIPLIVLSMEKSLPVSMPPEVQSDDIWQAFLAPDQCDVLPQIIFDQRDLPPVINDQTAGSKRKKPEEDEIKKLDERLQALEKDTELETNAFTHQQRFQGAVTDRLQRIHSSLQLAMARQLHEEQEKEKKRMLFEAKVQERLQRLEAGFNQIKSTLGEMNSTLKYLLNDASSHS